MSSQLLDRLADILGADPAGLRSLTGGCVGDVYCADLVDGGRVVVKVDEGATPRLDVEAMMLDYLHKNSALPVPDVLHSEADLLVIEFIENDRRPSPAAEIEAADALAALHDINAEAYGFDMDTLIGGLNLPNPKHSNWPEFFAQYRLCDMARRCLDAEKLDEETVHRVEALAADIDKFLDVNNPPSLLHGDVWGGNVLFNQGHLAGFIDPATYYGDPEVELAFISLFDTFGEPFYARYSEHHPIAPGFFEVRKDLYNLYPLLVHVRLFGGSYVVSLRSILRQLGY